MKRLVVGFLALSGLALLGCDSDRDVTHGDIGADADWSSDAFAVVGAEDLYANLEPATLDESMRLDSPLSGRDFQRHPRHPGHDGSHLGPVLRLFLRDAEQRESILAVLLTHRDAVRVILEEMREVNLPLIEAANAERLAIRERYDSGEIDRDEARRLMRELTDRTRAAVRGNPANAEFLLALCEARGDLFASIRLVLNDTQRQLWDAWIELLPDRDCSAV